MEPKILITGTGRCGTTFLIKLFSFLGMDTGYTAENYKQCIEPCCNSGMENEHTSPRRVIKNPTFLTRIPEIVSSVPISHVVIPIRRYRPAAQSRVSHGGNPGGLWGAHDEPSQIAYYHKILAEYLVHMVTYDIPTIFLDFERMIVDKAYLYERFKPAWKEGVTEEAFSSAYDLASSSSKPSV